MVDVIPIKGLARYKRRLLALADHIETVPQELFDMSVFREGDHDTIDDCGTVGCILGHAPALLHKKFKVPYNDLVDETSSRGSINFMEVTHEFGCFSGDPMWYYLFHPDWKHTDNTPIGAAKRIRWVVEHNGVPANYNVQLYDRDLLSYL